MKHFYFVVEGAHDLAVIGRTLTLLGFKDVKRKRGLSPMWSRMIPVDYPFREDFLDRITPQPSFLQNSDISIAIDIANGISEIVGKIRLNIGNMTHKELHQLNGIAIFCDADEKPADVVVGEFMNEIDALVDIGVSKEVLLNGSGLIAGVNMRAGIFVFPNHKDSGTLEDLLLEGAEESYPELVPLAKTYITGIPHSYKEKWNSSKEKKALVGCIANVLHPGTANHTSIYYDNWVCDNTIEKCVSIKCLRNFITNILELS